MRWPFGASSLLLKEKGNAGAPSIWKWTAPTNECSGAAEASPLLWQKTKIIAIASANFFKTQQNEWMQVLFASG